MAAPLRLDASRLRILLERENAAFMASHPRSRALYERALQHWLYGTPMHWMQQWPGSYPIYVAEAQGARVVDVDGNVYTDFALGDTGAMFGHAHPAVVAAISRQLGQGSTMMLPTEDAQWVGEELARRFGLRYWQVTTSATDANRFIIRLCRMMSGKSKVLTFNWNYHGSVDETQAELDGDGHLVPRSGVHPNAMEHDRTTRLLEFNDVRALEAALREGDVACVLTEPVLTNVGIVPPDPGFHDALRRLTRENDVALVIDETHTISTGPRGYSGEFGLDPDFFVLGKSIAGGIPVAVWGASEQMARKVWSVLPHFELGQEINHFGFGGTLAGSALQMSGIRATLEHAMTENNYHHMIHLAETFEEGVIDVLAGQHLPWHVTRLGARVEYLFLPQAPRNGGEAHHGRHALLEAFIHLFLLNRGILLTPFHNMALMCPFSAPEQVDAHTRALGECLTTLRTQGALP